MPSLTPQEAGALVRKYMKNPTSIVAFRLIIDAIGVDAYFSHIKRLGLSYSHIDEIDDPLERFALYMSFFDLKE